MLDFVSGQPTGILILTFLLAAIVVWLAGTRLVREVAWLARRYDIGHALAGMLLLGGITSLPEVAAVSSASLQGNPGLAVNSLLGSSAMNLLLLVVADAVIGRDALTRVAARPTTLMQGVLGMMLLGAAAIAIVVGDVPVPGTRLGVGSLLIAIACVAAMRISATFGRRGAWERGDVGSCPRPPAEQPDDGAGGSAFRLIGTIALLGLAILAAGALLSVTADSIAETAGLSTGIVGFLLVGFATSLPELSSVTAAARARHYELAVGDILGTNLFNLVLLALVDALGTGELALSVAGPFETLGALVAMLMTGAFVVGLLERRDRTLFRMGYDAIAALLIFVAGVALMARVA